MRKRWKAAVATVVACSMMLLPFSSIKAEEEEKTDTDTGYKYVLYQEGNEEGAVKRAEITGYTTEQEEVVLNIPQQIGGYEVGSIGNGAFKGNTKITGVTIPEGVTRIGYEAFQECENLVSVSVPASVTDWSDESMNSYDSSAFRGCTALAEVTLAEGLQVLGQSAFYGCTALERVTIPSTVKEFHSQTFYGCTALKILVLREGMEAIGYQAFGGCTALEEVTIPSTINHWSVVRASLNAEVHDCAPFINCTSLKKVTFTDGITTLSGFQGVIGCPLVEELDIPASVKNISHGFTKCANLKKVTLHDGLETMGVSAFEGCTSLTEIQVPETVTTIKENVFKNCTSLERLVLPAATVSLSGGITTECTGLKEIYLLAPQMKNGYQALSMASDGKLYCLEGSATYGTYLSGMGSNRDKVVTIPATGASAEGYKAAYDGQAHEVAAVTDIQEGDEVLYQVNDGISQTEIPKITEPGNYKIVITVKRDVPGEVLKYSLLRVTAQIKKRQCTMSLADVEVEEGQDYALAVQGYEGTGTPSYSYYKDAACTQVCDGKPQTAGVYYVRADIAETDYDMAVQSNAAKITINEKDDSGTNPTQSPAPSQNPDINPTTDPGNNPSSSEKPGNDPGNNPSASENPGGNPSASENPGKDPSASEKPGITPSTGPSVSEKPNQTAVPTKQPAPKVKKASLKKVKSPKKKTLQAQWKKITGVSGYQVQIALDSKFKKGKKKVTVASGKTTKKTIKGLKRKKKYYVRVRAYKAVKGKKYYGSWSKVKTARVK